VLGELLVVKRLRVLSEDQSAPQTYTLSPRTRRPSMAVNKASRDDPADWPRPAV